MNSTGQPRSAHRPSNRTLPSDNNRRSLPDGAKTYKVTTKEAGMTSQGTAQSTLGLAYYVVKRGTSL